MTTVADLKKQLAGLRATIEKMEGTIQEKEEFFKLITKNENAEIAKFEYEEAEVRRQTSYIV
ncbi:MAG: hypothetical protein ABR909_06965 [Candidatus Bathyarchaeia archaeon]|jgi:hypothetical protein